MKHVITIILSVGLSVLAVWLLLPEMEKYYAEKNGAKEKTEKEVEKTKEAPEETIVQDAESPKPALTLGITEHDWMKIKYTMLNNTSKPIKNVKLRFIYFDTKGNQIHYENKTVYCTLEPGLTQSFEQYRAPEVGDRYGVRIEVLEYNVKGLF